VVAEDVRGLNTRAGHRSFNLALAIVVIAVLAAEIGADLTWHQSPSELGSYLIQLFGTLIGASLAIAGGIWLFHHQEQETEEKLKKKLAARTAVELQMNLDRLEEEKARITFYDSAGGEALGPPVMLGPLSAVALRDWLRSNVLEPEDAMDAMKREGRINAHNEQMQVLWSQWSAGTPGLATSPEFRLMIENLAARQKFLKDDCRRELQRLRAQGVVVPD
jgi:hypothetical protein